MEKEINTVVIEWPENYAKYGLGTLQGIIDKIEPLEYLTKDGLLPLSDNEAFVELKEMAKSQLNRPLFLLYYKGNDNVSFLKSGLPWTFGKLWLELPLMKRLKMLWYIYLINAFVHALDRYERICLTKWKESLSEKLINHVNKK